MVKILFIHTYWLFLRLLYNKFLHRYRREAYRNGFRQRLLGLLVSFSSRSQRSSASQMDSGPDRLHHRLRLADMDDVIAILHDPVDRAARKGRHLFL